MAVDFAKSEGYDLQPKKKTDYITSPFQARANVFYE
jgi:hypothetical protein